MPCWAVLDSCRWGLSVVFDTTSVSDAVSFNPATTIRQTVGSVTNTKAIPPYAALTRPRAKEVPSSPLVGVVFASVELPIRVGRSALANLGLGRARSCFDST